MAALLVTVMLLASGRLLACGWECIDELAAPAAASCHEDSGTDRHGLLTVALAKVGEGAHACLPEVAEPRVTAAKRATVQALAAAPLVTAFLTRDSSTPDAHDHRHVRHLRVAPHSPAPFVLRI